MAFVSLIQLRGSKDLAIETSCLQPLIPAVCPCAPITRGRAEEAAYVLAKRTVNKEGFALFFPCSSEQNRNFSAVLLLRRSWYVCCFFFIFFTSTCSTTSHLRVKWMFSTSSDKKKLQLNIPVSYSITVIFRPHATRQRTVPLDSAVTVNEGCYGIIENICCPCTATTAAEREVSFCCLLGLILPERSRSRARRGLDFCLS